MLPFKPDFKNFKEKTIIEELFKNALVKVWTFWEAHIIWKNLPHGFDVY